MCDGCKPPPRESMPFARVRVEELSKFHQRMHRSKSMFWNAKGGKVFPSGRPPSGYLAAKPFELNQTL